MTTTDAFVRSLLDLPALDRETERSLAIAARSGDLAARSDLITAGLRFVAMRARLLGFGGDALGDAVQSGAIGLITAVDRFDPDRGVRLATFAWWWIGEAMRGAYSDDRFETLPDELASPVQEVGHALSSEVPEVLRVRFRIDEDPGPPRSRGEVAELLGLSVSQIRTREARAMREMRAGLAKVMHRAPRAGADPL